jgi:hypothetical protein
MVFRNPWQKLNGKVTTMDKIEHDIQSAFIAEARKIPGAEMLHAIPNAVPVRTGGMGKEAAKIARIIAQKYSTKEGRLTGVPDLFLPRPVRLKSSHTQLVYKVFNGLYMETKRPAMVINGKKKSAGELTHEQAKFILYADSAGYAVAVYFSVQEGIDTVQQYLSGEHSNARAVELAMDRLKK